MEIDRRHFLIGTALMLSSTSRAFAGVLESEAEAGDVEAGDLIAACRRPDGSYSVVVLTLDGMIVREIPLEGRGHDIAFERSSGTAVVFARRPGSFALAFDVHGRRNPTLITTPMIRSHIWPASTAAMKIRNFPMKPAVPGMPASESMNRVISAANPGRVRASPAKDSIRSQS